MLELLLVIAIIASLAALIFLSLNPAGRLNDAFEARVQANADDIEKALHTYLIDNNSFPNTLLAQPSSGYYDICKQGEVTDCVSLDSLVPGYLPILPEDTRYSSATATGFKLKLDKENLKVEIKTNSEYLNIINSGVTLAEGLMGYWTLNETSWTGSTGEVLNSVGTIHGTSVGTPIKSMGRFSKAGSLDGSNDYVDLQNPAALQLGIGNISAWIKTTNAGTAYRGIVAKQSAYGMFLRDNEFGIYDWGAATWRGSGVLLNDNQWHLISVKFHSGVVNGTVLYVDGQQVLVTTMSVSNQSIPLQIGWANAPGQYFAGLIDDVRVYNRGLNVEEQGVLYQWGPSPIAHWKLDEGSGTTTINTANSVNANLGSSSAAPAWQNEANCKYGKCLYFDGGDFVNTNTDISWDETNNISISLWAKPITISASNRGLLGKLYADWEWAFYQNSNGMYLVYWNTAGGHTNGMDNGWGNSFVANEWTHYEYTWDGSIARFYSNGTLVTTHPAINPVLNQDRSNSVMIGGNIYVWSNGYFSGWIDDVRVYDYVRIPGQVTRDMNNV